MILKLTNKSKNFYSYLGKFFGSRIVQSTTQDRIYDDSDKIWYVYLSRENVTSFISISKEQLKNIYSTNYDHLEQLLNEVKKDYNIKPSTVTNVYLEVYKKCNYFISDKKYINFVKIWSEKNEQ